MKKCIPLNCYSFYTFLYLLILENKLNTPSKEAKQRLERETKNRETKTFQIKNLSNMISSPKKDKSISTNLRSDCHRIVFFG